MLATSVARRKLRSEHTAAVGASGGAVLVRCCWMTGNAGRYRSLDSGPSAVARPRAITALGRACELISILTPVKFVRWCNVADPRSLSRHLSRRYGGVMGPRTIATEDEPVPPTARLLRDFLNTREPQ